MRIAIPRSKVSVRFARSGGPGGQNVNKVETKVELRLRLDDLGLPRGVRDRIARNLGRRVGADGAVVVTSSKHRLRSHNLRDSFEKLERLLDRAAEPDVPRIATKPTRGSLERRRDEKSKRALKKRDRRARPDED